MKKNIIIVCIAAAGLIVWLNFREPTMPTPEIPDYSSRSRYEQGEIQSVELAPVGGFVGMGVSARIWDGKLYAHSINADIDAPGAGKFYEGWLILPESSELISTGSLKPNAIGYGLSFTSTDNLAEYTGVLVTLETESLGSDGKPETHVLEGSF